MKLNNNTVHVYPLLALVVGLLGCPPSGPDPAIDTGDTGAAISADDDEDGFTVADGDCDDSNPSVYPGAEELCDGLATATVYSRSMIQIPIRMRMASRRVRMTATTSMDCRWNPGCDGDDTLEPVGRTKTRMQTVTVMIRTLPSTPGPKNSVTAWIVPTVYSRSMIQTRSGLRWLLRVCR